MNGALMIGQLVTLDEALIANIATVSLSGMTPDMSFKVISLSKTFWTVWTLIRLQAVVSSTVHYKIVSPMETFTADSTKVSFFVGMILLVNPQIRRSWKRFRTEFTFVRFNSLVPPHVYQQVIIPKEALATLGAQKRFSLLVQLPNVQTMISSVRKLFPTKAAFKCLRFCMGLNMRFQTFCRGESFIAYSTKLLLFSFDRSTVFGFHMITEMFGTFEGLLTKLTTERSLLGVEC